MPNQEDQKKSKKSKVFDDTVTVVGFSYRMTKHEITSLAATVSTNAKGLQCKIVPEPTNKFDPMAIKVLTKEWGHIGYIRRPTNESISRLLDRGWEVRLCRLTFVDEEHNDGDLHLRMRKQKAS